MNIPPVPGCAVVGAGRLGTALFAALGAAGVTAAGPFPRGFDGTGHDVVLLCVPDDRIADAAAALTPRAGLVVGHTSGARGLDVLAPHEAFGLHPLMTVPADVVPRFTDAGCAVAERTPQLLALFDVLSDRTRALAARSTDAATTDPTAAQAA